jgi:uncharacterized protein involved in exopolysaccharide biosynthesis
MLERNRAERKPIFEGSQEPKSDELSIADVMAFANHYWPLVAITMVVSCALGILYIMSATPTYTAVSQLLIEASQPSSATIITSESSVAPDTPQIESEIAVLTSEQILQKASQRVDQAKAAASKVAAAAAPNAAASETHGWFHDLLWGSVTAPPVSKNAQAARLREEIKEIQTNLDVKRIGLSFVLELSYRDKDPATAAAVVNAIGDAYVQDKIDGRIQNARQGSMWLEARIEEIRHLMNEAALDVQEFKARRDYRLADRPEGIESPLEPPLPGVPERSVQAPAAKTGGAKPAPATPELPTLEELDSRAQTYRKIYESYLQAYTDTVQRQSYPATSSRVITRAEPPERASSPKKLLTLIASLVLGGFLGLGISLVHLSFDQTVRSSRQIWRSVGAPLLGQVGQPPHIDRLPWLAEMWAKVLGRPHASKSSLRVVQNRPLSRTSRELAATALALQNTAYVQEAQVIGLLDAGEGGNSAAVSSNLALLNARAGKRTLLVETQTVKKNLAFELKPTLHQGLEDVINDGAAVENAIETSIHEPMLSLLMVRGTGAVDFWTEGRIAKLRDVLQPLKGRYDTILVRLPPASQYDHTSQAVDGVVIVTKLWSTQMPELAMATTRLRIADKSILGVIIAGIA